MSDEPKQNKNHCIKEQINESEIINSNSNKKQEDLMMRLKEVHCKSEEKTFDLNEKFNQIKEDLQKLIDEYKIECDKSELENNEIDFSSIKDYINEYMINERNNSINSINNTFEKINGNIEEITENNRGNISQIENVLFEFKNEFEQLYNDTVNHMLETRNQNEEINNKLNSQMKEQFAKIYELINEEEQTSNNSQIERIKSIQNLIRNLLKNVKNEKIKL
jgi:hypothetical protein